MLVESSVRPFLGFTWRTTVLHLLTYTAIGSLSYFLVAQPYWSGPEAVPGLREPMSDHVQQWMWIAQILRGILLAAVLYPLRSALLQMGRWGGLMIAALLLIIGWLAGIAGLIEGLVYTTTTDLEVNLVHLPEIVVQTLLFGYLLLGWERRAQARRTTAAQEDHA
jgi:hypothetical protein